LDASGPCKPHSGARAGEAVCRPGEEHARDRNDLNHWRQWAEDREQEVEQDHGGIIRQVRRGWDNFPGSAGARFESLRDFRKSVWDKDSFKAGERRPRGATGAHFVRCSP